MLIVHFCCSALLLKSDFVLRVLYIYCLVTLQCYFQYLSPNMNINLKLKF